jgi:hypothetical protein
MDIGELELRVPTVSEINEQMVEFTKEYVRQKVAEILTEVASDENLPRDKLMMYIRKINFDDVSSTINAVKRPRKKVESKDRCRAKTSKAVRCTRKKKDILMFCGSHETSRPYGEIGDSDDESLGLNSVSTPKIRTKPIIKAKASTETM